MIGKVESTYIPKTYNPRNIMNNHLFQEPNIDRNYVPGKIRNA